MTAPDPGQKHRARGVVYSPRNPSAAQILGKATRPKRGKSADIGGVPAPETDIQRWRRDPCIFIETQLVDPETGCCYVLNDAEKVFMAHAFELNDDGTLKHVEWVFGAIKKSGKSAFASLLILVVILLFSPPYSEAICAANDYEQAASRSFRTLSRIVACSPALAADAVIGRDKLTFKTSKSTISAISSDAGSAAGSNASITVFDELWAYTSERSRRLWDEMTQPPTRKFAVRLTVTYAGYSGESELLEEIYKRGMAGRLIGDELWQTDDGLLMAWHTKPIAPWQSPAWLKRMESNTRRNAFLRLFQNQWVSTESEFIPIDVYDSRVDPTWRPPIAKPGMPVWIGVDASTKRDSTAIAVVTYEAGRVVLVAHKIWQPSPGRPLDFKSTIEAEILQLARRYSIVACRFDPWQMQSVGQRLRGFGINAFEFVQSLPNLAEASSNLLELFQSGGIVLYEAAEIRRAVAQCVAIEVPNRGWRISKTAAAHRIDVVVALAMAALAAVQAGQSEVTAVPFASLNAASGEPWREFDPTTGEPLGLDARMYAVDQWSCRQ